MRKILVLFVVITLLGTSVSIPASAAVKAGAKCLTKGQIKTSQGKRFTCTKLGKKLVWDKGRLIVSPTPTPSASPAPTPTATTVQKATDVYSGPSELSDNIDSCKIKEVNLNGPRNGRAGPEGALISLPSGFPVVKPATQRIGTVKWALIPIDFSDLKGESSFRSRVDSQMEFLTEWYFTVSDGNFKVDWSVHNNWVTLPKPSSQYAINDSVNLRDSDVGQALFRDAMASADPVFDFTSIQYVIFLLPKGQSFLQETSQGFPWDQLVIDTRTNEGKVSGFAIPGVFMDQIGREYWSYWAHEFGHAISLAHVGRSRGSLPPFSPFDIMGSQDGSTRELSGWLRFVAEWLPDEKVYCKKFENLNSQSLTIVPLNSKSEGLKMAVVPVSTSKAIVIESRRFTKFSCGIPTKNGVLVYVYDANLSHGEDFLMPVYPTGRLKENHNSSAVPCNSEPFADPLLYQGDRVTIEGMSVEVLTHGNFDHIKISELK
jgi:M6 family metalloprotease-like protein